ncbi:MAG: succinate dehydrogenase, cytochrome b556 subunit [Acidobacteriota bacterium]
MITREGRTGIGMWPWLIQRITGAFLLLFLGVHFFITHFSAKVVNSKIDFQTVADRFRETTFWHNWDWLLLAFALFHGVNGIRAIILDFGVKPLTARVLFWLMMVICVVVFVYGFTALTAFRVA